MKKEIKLKRIKETEIVKRLTAELPPWWRQIRLYAGITFAISTSLLAVGSFVGLPVGIVAIIKLIVGVSATIAGAAQMTKK